MLHEGKTVCYGMNVMQLMAYKNAAASLSAYSVDEGEHLADFAYP